VIKVLPSAIVSVDPVAGAVIATLLTLVAVATPMVGVVNVGDVANTARPVPVSSDNAPAKPAELVSVFCLPVTAAPAAASA
jgi:phosphoglycerate dehydrogenase-like enzyme